MIGIISRLRMNMAIILIDATISNSLSKVLSVNIKVAKPEAVVILVSRVALPTLVITRCRDLA